MGHIFLSGGGNETQSKKLDELLIRIIPPSKKMLYIPVASRNTRNFDDCYKWIMNSFSQFNFDRIEMWTDLKNKKYEDLEKYGAIYLGGGNTFYLLNEIRNAGFDKQLQKYHKNDGILYGGSAGAIIFGKDIGVAVFGGDSDKNLVGLSNLSGLNLIRNYAITCHYRENDDERIFDYVKKNDIEVIALHEDVGLHSTADKIKVVGYQDAFLFTEKEKIILELNSSF